MEEILNEDILPASQEIVTDEDNDVLVCWFYTVIESY